jgi:hypothetical protein
MEEKEEKVLSLDDKVRWELQGSPVCLVNKVDLENRVEPSFTNPQPLSLTV